MAQIEQSDKGKKKKGAQKKMSIHVDFTPMVDMNMLLITFFMLCTTMIKSQTLQIVLPTNENVKKEQQSQAKQSEAITLILDTEYEGDKPKVDGETGKTVHNIYYYEGIADTLFQPPRSLEARPNPTYEGLINAIDEMNINQISRYSIELPSHTDTVLLKHYEQTHPGETIIRPLVRKNSQTL